MLDELETPVTDELHRHPPAGDGRRLVTSVEELYEVWAGQSESRAALAQSLDPARYRLALRGFRRARPEARRRRSSTSARATRATRFGSCGARPPRRRARPAAEARRARPGSRGGGGCRRRRDRGGDRVDALRRRKRRLDLVPRRARPCRRSCRIGRVRARRSSPADRCSPTSRSRPTARAARGSVAVVALALTSIDRAGSSPPPQPQASCSREGRLEGEWRERMIEDGSWDRERGSARRSRACGAERRRRLRRGSRRRLRGRPALGHLPAARQALPHRLRLGTAWLAGSPRASLDLVGEHAARRAFAPRARRVPASTRSSRGRTRPARRRTASRSR